MASNAEQEILDTIHLIHGATTKRLRALGVRLEAERMLRSFAGDLDGVLVLNRLLRETNTELDKRDK